MEVLSGPWADVALLLRQTMAQADGHTIYPLWLFVLLLFLSVCLLLLQLISYLSWKLRQVDAELSESPEDRGAPYRRLDRSTSLRRRRSVG